MYKNESLNEAQTKLDNFLKDFPKFILKLSKFFEEKSTTESLSSEEIDKHKTMIIMLETFQHDISAIASKHHAVLVVLLGNGFLKDILDGQKWICS